ncbi:ubiquinol oxidase subunit II [Sphingomonas hengshuiensis]|uniref:ubiquinol oxidase subunit II n=1 Tax=Sphingomonas hengshuiensis TaxID=1609977 RepID=UPI0005C9BDF7|nr:ubiquinol oxidase subunit II [Sphingomonas hengshuiensis]
MSDFLRPLRLSKLRPLAALALLPLMAGCKMVVLDPAGDVARQQGNLVIASTLLMLVIIVPVMALTIFFAWRYRAANQEATYKPDWDHSTQLELVIWAAPLLIIICLGALTWVGTHLLDPYRPLARTAPGRPVTAEVRPLDVQVVALDWKWLFIYPELGIATVNEMAVPVDRPVRFRISASSVMNSFYIPALAGQIYAMPGMETRLHGAFDRTGDFTGFSANYSGAGFSNMRFKARSLSDRDFAAWVQGNRASGATLDRATYLALERPSAKDPVRRFAAVDPNLFDAVVNLCVDPGKMCMHDMMAVDARGGMGRGGIANVRELAYDKFGARGTGPASTGDSRYVAAICAAPTESAMRASPGLPSMAPLRGAGLTPMRKPAPPITLAADTGTAGPQRPTS